jgi:hypothetical protein
MVNENVLSDKIRSLLSQCAKVKGPLEPPIEPASLADLCGVLAIEHRPMIPEAVLAQVQGGFTIYLQDNFIHRPNARRRERFTIAHELVHTFYYDRNGGVPRRKRGAPRGQTLESLCHDGARQILVPEGLLRRELRVNGDVASAERILRLADMFDVSPQVIIMRLHELDVIEDPGFAAILVDAPDGGRQQIQAACYGPLLLCSAIKPKRGSDFDSWVLPLLDPKRPDEATWTHKTRTATITAKKLYRSNRSFILELRFGRAEPMLA